VILLVLKICKAASPLRCGCTHIRESDIPPHARQLNHRLPCLQQLANGCQSHVPGIQAVPQLDRLERQSIRDGSSCSESTARDRISLIKAVRSGQTHRRRTEALVFFLAFKLWALLDLDARSEQRRPSRCCCCSCCRGKKRAGPSRGWSSRIRCCFERRARRQGHRAASCWQGSCGPAGTFLKRKFGTVGGGAQKKRKRMQQRGTVCSLIWVRNGGKIDLEV